MKSLSTFEHKTAENSTNSIEQAEVLPELKNELSDLHSKTTEGILHNLNHLEIAKDPEIERINKRILSSALQTHPQLAKGLNKQSLKNYQITILKAHPELARFLVMDLNFNAYSTKNRSQLDVYDQISLIALEGTLKDFFPISIGLKNKDGGYNYEKFKERYRSKYIETLSELTNTFVWKQRKHLGSVTDTLIKEYGVNPRLATKYKNYLEKLQQEVNASKPQEMGTGGGIIVGFILGLLVASAGYIVYDTIVNPKSKEVYHHGIVELGDPETLSQLVTAQVPFQVSGELTESYYGSESDYPKRWKSIVNSLQSKSITLMLKGKIGVEYNVSSKDGASYHYDPLQKTINIVLPEPQFSLRESKAHVLTRNSEVFEIEKFNNTETKLIDSLQEQALQDATKQQELLLMSLHSASDIFYQIYAPILKHFNQEVRGVKITIKQKNNSPLERYFLK